MVQILLVEKSGTIKEINVKQFDELYLSKKAGFKSEKGFSQINGWTMNKFHVFLYGKTEGRAGQENKYDFPPPSDNTLFFGGCLLIAKNAKNEHIDLDEKSWKIIYEKLFGGFEDLGEEDSEEDEEDEDDDLSQTKQGYAKDGFVVDDNEDENDDEDEDEDEVDEVDEDEDEDDNDDDEEIERPAPKKRVQPKRSAKKAPVQNVFLTMQQEEEYMNCESELSEEEYV